MLACWNWQCELGSWLGRNWAWAPAVACSGVYLVIALALRRGRSFALTARAFGAATTFGALVGVLAAYLIGWGLVGTGVGELVAAGYALLVVEINAAREPRGSP